jgi:DNA-directed RNA polymerase subunit RPC12/RpoP
MDRRTLRRHKTIALHVDGGWFRCVNCRQLVTVTWLVSGVHNRNHCPYCLHSRHLDLLRAGDRLAACKGAMQPVGLTFKRIRNKYGDSPGELMLVHRCTECGKLSINRIAADDDDDALLALLDHPAHPELDASGIRVLTISDLNPVQAQLFGKN